MCSPSIGFLGLGGEYLYLPNALGNTPNSPIIIFLQNFVVLPSTMTKYCPNNPRVCELRLADGRPQGGAIEKSDGGAGSVWTQSDTGEDQGPGLSSVPMIREGGLSHAALVGLGEWAHTVSTLHNGLPEHNHELEEGDENEEGEEELLFGYQEVPSNIEEVSLKYSQDLVRRKHKLS
jgi:hypothetical protein